MENEKIGIALSGGGARGFAHLGVLKALEEKGITPDIISGVSAGAIVGAFIASGKKADEVMAIMKENKFTDYAKANLPINGLLSLNNLRDKLEKHLDKQAFSELEIPFYIAISDLNEGKVEYLNEGPLISIIQASASIPVLFSPVKIDGRLYVDGGLFDNLPIKPLLGSCDKIIAVNAMPIERTEKIDNLVEIALRTFQLSVSGKNKEMKRKCDLFIEPKGLKDFHILDTKHADKLFEIGYDYCSNLNIELFWSY
ncbi:patatin-like phospholipase family protein [Fuchsiella alkaliacetigena]|uniref:patatin-like phospholipase family protein n=1 Tax=Fuchsiella alkaliacetigena TaxID=957042 RepID=UPI00200B0F1F|nr:patatin-like phospholipase family protein [Fuchsiella alkaliacetigena]MCK8826052.1 patatin-like phospholipase family protein [Fuchsiella alkaliacetigena]